MHRLVPAFRAAVFSAAHAAIARDLGFEDPRVTQSLIIAKAGRTGARVIPHQDGCSNFTDPPGAATFWYALEDATAANGCLLVAPGTHRTEPLVRRCRADARGQAAFVPLEAPAYAEVDGVEDPVQPKRTADGGFEWTKLEVKSGTLVLMHGNLMHASEANRSAKSRVAFNFSVVEGTRPWLEDSYLQPYEGETEFEKLEPKQ